MGLGAQFFCEIDARISFCFDQCRRILDLMGWKSQMLRNARGGESAFISRAALFFSLLFAVATGNLVPAQQMQNSAAEQAKQLYAEGTAALKSGDLARARKAFEDELKLN